MVARRCNISETSVIRCAAIKLQRRRAYTSWRQPLAIVSEPARQPHRGHQVSARLVTLAHHPYLTRASIYQLPQGVRRL